MSENNISNNPIESPIGSGGTPSNTYHKHTDENAYDEYPSYIAAPDNYALVIHEKSFPEVVTYLEEVFQSQFDTTYPVDGYENGIRMLNGTRIDWGTKFGAPRKPRLTINGQSLRSIYGEVMVHMILWLEPHVDHATRVDSAFNDMTAYGPTPESINRSLKTGKVYPSFFRRNTEGLFPLQYIDGHGKGDTLYIGTGDILARIYDKDGPTRYEVQYRNEYAVEAWEKHVEAAKQGHEALAHTCISIVLGRIEFKHDTNKNRSLNPVVSWWKRLLKSVRSNPFRIKRQPVEPTIGKFIKWMDEKMAKSIAKYAAYQRNHNVDNPLSQLEEKGKPLMTLHDVEQTEVKVETEVEVKGKLILKRPIFQSLSAPMEILKEALDRQYKKYMHLEAQARLENLGPDFIRRQELETWRQATLQF